LAISCQILSPNEAIGLITSHVTSDHLRAAITEIHRIASQKSWIIICHSQFHISENNEFAHVHAHHTFHSSTRLNPHTLSTAAFAEFAFSLPTICVQSSFTNLKI
jgi:hypothetical protein